MHKRLFGNLPKSLLVFYRYYYLYTLTHKLLIGVVEEKAVGMDVHDTDKEFIANFYKFAFVGLMLDWIKDGMKKDPQQIIDRLSILIEGDITRALDKYRLDKPHQNP